MVRNLDALARYEEFRETIAPALQKDLAAGLSAEAIVKKYQAIIAARMVTAALLEPDHARAATVGDKVLDRALGKAVQKQEIEGRFSNMSDEELQATLASALGASINDENTSH
jgi:hypothetical protein